MGKKLRLIEEVYISICLHPDNLFDIYVLDFKGMVIAHSLQMHSAVLHEVIELFVFSY